MLFEPRSALFIVYHTTIGSRAWVAGTGAKGRIVTWSSVEPIRGIRLRYVSSACSIGFRNSLFRKYSYFLLDNKHFNLMVSIPLCLDIIK
jgi:hypothetical protein